MSNSQSIHRINWTQMNTNGIQICIHPTKIETNGFLTCQDCGEVFDCIFDNMLIIPRSENFLKKPPITKKEHDINKKMHFYFTNYTVNKENEAYYYTTMILSHFDILYLRSEIMAYYKKFMKNPKKAVKLIIINILHRVCLIHQIYLNIAKICQMSGQRKTIFLIQEKIVYPLIKRNFQPEHTIYPLISSMLDRLELHQTYYKKAIEYYERYGRENGYRYQTLAFIICVLVYYGNCKHPVIKIAKFIRLAGLRADTLRTAIHRHLRFRKIHITTVSDVQYLGKRIYD